MNFFFSDVAMHGFFFFAWEAAGNFFSKSSKPSLKSQMVCPLTNQAAYTQYWTAASKTCVLDPGRDRKIEIAAEITQNLD